jgi:hypothetical protein
VMSIEFRVSQNRGLYGHGIASCTVVLMHMCIWYHISIPNTNIQDIVYGCPYRKKRKDSAGSDDTASMIKGEGYLGARTRQPPTAQTIRKKLMWTRGLCAVALRPKP